MLSTFAKKLIIWHRRLSGYNSPPVKDFSSATLSPSGLSPFNLHDVKVCNVGYSVLSQ